MKRALDAHQAPQKTESQMDHCNERNKGQISKPRSSLKARRKEPYPVESSSPDLRSSLEGLISSVIEDSGDPEKLADRAMEGRVGQLELREVEQSAAETDVV